MGIDAKILLKCSGEPDTGDLWSWGDSEELESLEDSQWTHEVSTLERYYDPTSARGAWPRILERLVDWMAHPAVEEVWYGSDCGGFPPVRMTPEALCQITAFYVAHGNRPYREDDYDRHLEEALGWPPLGEAIRDE